MLNFKQLILHITAGDKMQTLATRNLISENYEFFLKSVLQKRLLIFFLILRALVNDIMFSTSFFFFLMNPNLSIILKL